DCVDGLTEASYARHEAFLEAAVRRSQSTWSFVREEDQSRFVKTLEDDLKSGEWNRRYGEWRTPFNIYRTMNNLKFALRQLLKNPGFTAWPCSRSRSALARTPRCRK